MVAEHLIENQVSCAGVNKLRNVYTRTTSLCSLQVDIHEQDRT